MAVIYESDEKLIELLKTSIDFAGKRVFDIGCGEGSLTVPLAAMAKNTVAIDPDLEKITLARQNTPADLSDRLKFLDTSIENFNLLDSPSPFDIALYLWSL